MSTYTTGTVERAKVLSFCEDLGFKPEAVEHIAIFPRYIDITLFNLNESGLKVLDSRGAPTRSIVTVEIQP